MSVVIVWSPLKPRPIPGGSDDLARIIHEFGNELSEKDIEKLDGMAAMCKEPNAYKELIGAIRTHHTIRVWGEW